MPTPSTDFIIAGQGISGSLLAWFLLQAGKKVVVIDPALDKTCSRVAAGLIHPVTGRRIVKTWNADILIPFARSTYISIEDKLGERFFEDYPVLELFNDNGHRNDWAGRSGEPGMTEYIREECTPEAVPDGINAPLGGRWVVNGGWLDTKRFTDGLRKYLLISSAFIKDKFSYDDLRIKEDKVIWKNIEAKKFIDCTGIAAIGNPVLTGLPFNPCKGELIHFSAEGLPKDMAVHGPIKIIPSGGYDYIAGATYDFTNINEETTVEGREKLEAALKKIINVPYTIIAHLASIRPSTKDRRPIVGHLHDSDKIYLLNGLGSKGALLGPWMAHHLTQHLVHDTAILDELKPDRKVN